MPLTDSNSFASHRNATQVDPAALFPVLLTSTCRVQSVIPTGCITAVVASCVSRDRQPFDNLLHTFVGQVEDIVSKAHSEGKRIRVVGNALSPNGIGLSEGAMISLGQCDRVLRVDKRAKTVTVEVRINYQGSTIR